MSRLTTLGVLGLCAALFILRCGTVPIDNKDGGADSGHPDAGGSDGGLSDAGTDAGTVPSCAGFAPPTVAMEVPLVCPAFANCGGEERGRWAYDGGCFNNPFQDVSSLCAGASYSNAAGTITGCVAFDGLSAERHASWTITGTVFLPTVCTTGNCATTQTTIEALFPGATCASGAGGCTCSLTTSGSTNDTALYVRDGGTLVVNGVDYPYCVNGDALRYKEAGSSPSEPEGRLLRAP